jgi:transcriptional regulator with XRE-family HTH domain
MLNERLKNLRLAKGLTLQQVGDVFGISRASVSSWESGTNQPDPRKLQKLAELFESTVEYLITGQGIGSSEASVANHLLTNVPFISWELLLKRSEKSHQSNLVACLYSEASDKAFATRYVSSSNLDWQPSVIPSGALIICDPLKEFTHGKHVIARLDDDSIVLGVINNSNAKGKFVLKIGSIQSAVKVDKTVQIIAVVLEWRIGGKL